MSEAKQTLTWEEWWAEFVRLAGPHMGPVEEIKDTIKELYFDDPDWIYSPSEALAEEVSRAQ